MNTFSLPKLISTLKKCLPESHQKYGLHEPSFVGNEWLYVKECLDTGWVSSVGKFVDLFEKKLAEFTGAKYAIATVNGTAALHVALLLSDVLPNDEVLLPSLSFVATANAVKYCNAIPHFVDSCESTLGIDALKLDAYLSDTTQISNEKCINKLTGRPIKALCVMHTFGHPVDLDALADLCQKYKLKLIEDAAEALGSFYKKVHVGHRGEFGALSFNGNKIITTGGGGALLTNNEQLAKLAKHITTTAKIPHPWLYNHDHVGFNYRLPNINAALGCAQLESLDKFLIHKRNLAHTFQRAFTEIEGISVIKEPDYAQSNYWLNALLLDKDYEMYRDDILAITNEAGIMTRPVWSLLHKLPIYSECPAMPLLTAESLEQRLINIPSSAILGEHCIK